MRTDRVQTARTRRCNAFSGALDQRPIRRILGGQALSTKLTEQGLGLSQIACVKSFGEPVVDGRKKVTCHFPLALTVQEPRQAGGRTQFPRLCMLRSRNGQGMLEIRLRLRLIPLRRLERDFAGNAMNLGLAPSFLGCLHRCHCVADAAPGIIELARIRVRNCQHELLLRCKYRRSGRPP